MGYSKLDAQVEKIELYLKNHPCLDYSAKELLTETAKLLREEADRQVDEYVEEDLST